MANLLEWLGPTCAVCENRLRLRDLFRLRFGIGVLCPQCNARLHMPLWVACLTVIPFYGLLSFPRYVSPLYGGQAVFALAVVVYGIAFAFIVMLPVRWRVMTRQWVIGCLMALAVIIGLFVVTWAEYHVA